MTARCLLTVLPLTALLIACAAPESPSQSSAAVTPSGDCIVVSSTGHVVGTDQTARDATAIVLATLRDFGSPKWTTPDGHRPTRAELTTSSITFVRPADLEVESTFKGETSSAKHAVVRGGSWGCDSFSFAPDPELAIGRRYVFFLTPLRDSEEKVTADLLIIASLPVDAKDIVDSTEGRRPLADVRAEIHSATGSPTP
jgi:hypothetical protein